MINFDLHIHSFASKYKESKAIVDKSNIENAHVLMSKLEEHNVGLFSITDHNRFWPELYVRFDELISSGDYPEVKGIVAGVEFDVRMDAEITISKDNRTIKAEEIYNLLDFSRGDTYTVHSQNESELDAPVLEFFETLISDISKKLNKIPDSVDNEFVE